MIRALALFALIAGVAAECPNACSGHGTCGAKDACSCYQNYQGNDCSERTCYFGIAHVDTPKGDLNADGYVSGPLTTVITGSEVYPWGTTEQYPNADANEGHFYMECSNKGICDRKTGECDCFDGYEGTACMRAACPNDCSGHGTCESIKELSELSSYDTTSHDVPTAAVVGSAAGTHHNFNSAIEESYAYDLWDQDKTMGCKCDPVYYGPDCSLRKCKYGVDPLFYDTYGITYQTTVIHLGSLPGDSDAELTNADEQISGTFKIVFYDVFGEKYVTKPINAHPTNSKAEDIQLALEALPNGVIANHNSDITNTYAHTTTGAVLVSKASVSGTTTTVGTIGAGTTGETGAGLGCRSGKVTGSAGGAIADADLTGPEFTVTFKTNPGILKTIELDTTQIVQPDGTGNDGRLAVPDEWVANSRQGQFTSRYNVNLGRVDTLLYGSKLLYTYHDSTALSNPPAMNDMIKIGAQEIRVTAATSYYLGLNEEYLGTSILPRLTDTGAVVTALAKAGVENPRTTAQTTVGGTTLTATNSPYVKADQSAAMTSIPAFAAAATAATAFDLDQQVKRSTSNTYTFNDVSTTALEEYIHNSLKPGAKLYINGCPSFVTSLTPSNAGSGSFVVGDEVDFECFSFSSESHIVYRRSDDPDNYNFYKTSADQAKITDGLLLTRGSSIVYGVKMLLKAAISDTTAIIATGKSFGRVDDDTNELTVHHDTASVAINTKLFINNVGPFNKVAATGAIAANAASNLDDTDSTGNSWLTDSDLDAGTNAANGRRMIIHEQIAAPTTNHGVAAGNIVALNGRRYKVKEAVSTGGYQFTLTEKYAGGSLVKLCDGCVKAYTPAGTAAAGANPSRPAKIEFNTVAAGADKPKLSIAAGEALLIEGYIHEDHKLYTDRAVHNSALVYVSGQGTYGSSIGTLASNTQTKDLYKAVNQAGYIGSIITESASTTTFQYVSQCSNRGSCDSSTGLCKCFKGYSTDNCDTQNMLAA